MKRCSTEMQIETMKRYHYEIFLKYIFLESKVKDTGENLDQGMISSML